jgi:hypothetical protein
VERPVEVTVFQRGELQGLRLLSPGRERKAAALAAGSTAALVLAAMAVTAAAVSAFDLVVHGPTFLVSWLGVAAGVAALSARRTRERHRRYALGAQIDADAFGPADVDLVRRVGRGDDYELGLVPGMTGVMEHGRSPLPIESLTRSGPVRMPLPADGKVCVEYGPATFVIRRRAQLEVAESPLSWGERLRRAVGSARRFVPLAGAGVPVAAMATFLGAVPAAMAVSDADMRSSIPDRATPLEIEQHIRAGAQRQARTLHQCFDPLPLSCQRPGFVGVGVSLSASGEVQMTWVTRTSYDRHDCPVSQCMANVVAGWFFESMPEAMKVVIPVQVRRTNKPLYDPRPTIAHPVVIGDGQGDGGALEAAPEEWAGR